MVFNKRLTRLEAFVGAGGGPCRHGVQVHRPDGTITGDLVCPQCGRERPIIRVVYEGEEKSEENGRAGA